MFSSLACASNGFLFATGSTGGMYRSTDQGNSWTFWGLNGVKALRVLCSSRGTLLAGTNSGLYCGSVNDTMWHRTLNNEEITSLFEHSSGNLLVGGLSYVWSSSDQGLTWNRSGPPESDLFIDCFSEVDSTELYAGTRAMPESFHNGIYRSTDAGKTWSFAGLNEWAVYSAVVTPSGAFIAGTVRGVFGTTDHGSSWTSLHTGLRDVHVSSLVTVDTAVVVVGTDMGIFRTSDSGESWTDCSNGITPKPVYAIDMDPGGNLYAANTRFDPWGGVYRSQDTGKTWTNVSGTSIIGLDEQVSALLVTRKGILYAAKNNKLFRSPDRGETWTFNELPASAVLFALASDSSDRIFAGFWGKGVFRTLDGGETWTSSTDIAGTTDGLIRCLAAKDTTWMFAGGKGGVFRSSNHGTSWDKMSNSSDVHAITVLPNGSIIASFWDGNLLRSTDNGVSWTTASSGLAFNEIQVNRTEIPWGATNMGVYKSIGAPLPVLTVTPTNRPVSGSAGSTSFTVSNTGTGIMSWTAASDQGWATISSGTTGNRAGTISVNYTANSSTTDSRTATITVAADGATGSPKQVTIRQAAATQADFVDVFPLHKGWTSTYAYGGYFSSSEHPTGTVISEAHETDTGFVAYQVLDSAPSGDTMTVWTVAQSLRFLTRRWGHYVQNGPQYDTTFIQQSTDSVLLYEDLRNIHELRCDSRVWRFAPTNFPNHFVRYSLDSTFDVWKVVGDQFGWECVFAFGRGVSFFQSTYTASGNSYSHYDHDEARLTDPLPTGVLIRESMPLGWSLFQNFPNPFNPSTTIRYGLPHKTTVHLSVFNTLGQQVALLENGEHEAGYHEIKFDGSGLSSGVYFYRIEAGSFVETKKLILTK
jgi:photosystem II stability/assembly factor-like uncharacterized protein